MNHHPLRLLPLLLIVAMLLPLGQALAAEKSHRVVLQVNDNDPDRMNLALNNAANLIAYYQDKGEPVQVEVVAYGPGLIMLVEGRSPVAERVKSFGQNFDNVSFNACGNTKANMTKKTGKEVVLLPEAKVVPAGVVHIMERQEQGWSYVKP